MSDTAQFQESIAQDAVDLSAQIALSIDREFGERVTCRRISGTKYRCNWWSPQSSSAYDNPGMHGLLVTTHVVKRSLFLTVTSTPEGLVATEQAGTRSGPPLRFSRTPGPEKKQALP